MTVVPLAMSVLVVAPATETKASWFLTAPLVVMQMRPLFVTVAIAVAEVMLDELSTVHAVFTAGAAAQEMWPKATADPAAPVAPVLAGKGSSLAQRRRVRADRKSAAETRVVRGSIPQEPVADLGVGRVMKARGRVLSRSPVRSQAVCGSPRRAC